MIKLFYFALVLLSMWAVFWIVSNNQPQFIFFWVLITFITSTVLFARECSNY